jgi:hypothetical protein
MTAGTRLHGEKSGEREQGEIEGIGANKRCLELLARRWSSPEQRTRQELDGDRGTDLRSRRTTMVLHGRARCERGARGL